MRLTLRLSPSLTSAGDPRFRFRFLLFDVRMCRRCDRPRFTFPVPVTLKRLAAPLCVFNFGIKSSENSRQLSAIGCQFHFYSRRMSDDRSGETCLSTTTYTCHSDPEQSEGEESASSLRRGLGDLRRRSTLAGRTLHRSLVLFFLLLLFLSFLLRLLRRHNRVKCVPLLPGTELHDA